MPLELEEAQKWPQVWPKWGDSVGIIPRSAGFALLDVAQSMVCFIHAESMAVALLLRRSVLDELCSWVALVSPVEKHVCMTAVVLGVLRALDLL